MVKEITHNGALIAIVIDNADIEEGTHPITDPKAPLQALMMRRRAGHVFQKHTHEELERTVSSLQEAVVVTKGRLLVTVCTREGNDVGAYEVTAGQCLILTDGGYRIETLEESSFYEFKNGPYADDKIML